MLEALIWAGGVGSYLLTAGVVYRKQYIRTFKEWRRWQADDPHKDEELWDDYYAFNRPRAKISYSDFMNLKSPRIPPWWLAPLWLPIGIGVGLKKILQPEVSVPDYIKIKELEKMGD